VLQLAAAAAVAGIILLGRSPVAGRARSHDAGEPRASAHGSDVRRRRRSSRRSAQLSRQRAQEQGGIKT
jgi:hypothetical protein